MEAIIPLNYDEVKSHLTSHKFIVPTAQVYQSFESSSKGFHTYGALGTILKNKIINLWRKLFVTSDVFEIDTPLLQGKEVLTNSGHVGKFNDLVIMNGTDTFRADHLVRDFCEKSGIKLDKPIDNFTKDELLEMVKLHKMCVNSENATISPKNLMFSFGDLYLRPEIAQGMFIEFDQFYNSGTKLPFGLAQVGKSYRNEISPQPFTRLREFTQAEVEYFFDPFHPNHPLFQYTVSHFTVPLLTQDIQLANSEVPVMTNLMEAVNTGVIVNSIMGYFLGKVYLFAKTLGLNDDAVRFRQHLPNELAHYAKQCWDLEIKLANGNWLECVGCAHRGDYDLKNHNIRGQNVIKSYETKVTKFKINLNNGESKEMAKVFYSQFKNKLYESQKEIENDPEYEKFKYNTHITTSVQRLESTVFPNVIEPSMGIDRIIFAVANNLLKKRVGDTDKIVFGLPLECVPYEIAVYALSNDDSLVNYVLTKLSSLNDHFTVHYDYSGTSIGKRYVRSDAIGVGLTITVDFKTLEDNTVTLRYTSGAHQDRIHISEIVETVNKLLKK